MATFDRRPRRQRKRRDPVERYLGELQTRVMTVFWTSEDATVREVAEALKRKRRDLAYTTVLTLVTRLWSRGLLTRKPDGRGFRYRAVRTRDEFLADLSDELIEQLFKDFGEIALARLGERLESLDPARRNILERAKRSK